jgi:hypothetical protein
MRSNQERRALQDRLRASSAELLADRAARLAHAEQYGAIEWPRAQEEPTAEPSPQQPPPAYRTMSPAERAPWDSWLNSAIADLRDEVQDAVSLGFKERDAEIDSLKAEILQLRADLTRNKSWWR